MTNQNINCDTQVVEITDLSVMRSGTQVIHDINLSISCGEFIGIVGPNGGGKSTLILTILGILKPETGSIKIYGHQPISKNVIGKISWVPQTSLNLPNNVRITVRELVKLGTLKRANFLHFWKKNHSLVEKTLQLVGLEDVANTPISSLSGGQRQRALIAKALVSEAEIILMDEPMVGVDRESRNSLLKLLDSLCHEENKTIIMISHDLSTIKQTVHRMIYLEETIRYDGSNSDFPELSELAELRGIDATHENLTQINNEIKQSNLDTITIVPAKKGDSK
ncbi:MAG: ABC transporter ATP-binding protein [Euryarchaeota archaeon]|nr:ABC transporter ATP-binding protein [Euryarchaeota archaeon]